MMYVQHAHSTPCAEVGAGAGNRNCVFLFAIPCEDTDSNGLNVTIHGCSLV